MMLVGCGGTGSSGSGSAFVRIVNAEPGLDSATFTFGVNVFSNALAYLAFTPTYTSISSGSSVQVLVTNSTGGTVATQNVGIASGNYYTAYAAGTLASPQLVLQTEDHSAPPSGDERINVMNLSPTVTTTDIYVTPTTTTSLTGVSPTFSNVSFGAAQSVVEPANVGYIVWFTQAGTKTVLTSLNTGILAAGALPRYILVDSSASAGSGQQLMSLSDN